MAGTTDSTTVLITLLSSVMQAKHLFCLIWTFFFFFPFKWHKTFVQTSFKNINKPEPLRLTWLKTHYQMSWRRTNFVLFCFFRKGFTNEMSLQNIQRKGAGQVASSHKILPKNIETRLVFFNFKQIETFFSLLHLLLPPLFFFSSLSMP